MPKSVRAIVLRRFDSGDSDRRLILLTREAGKLTAVAKGARKSASRLGSISEPLSTAVMNLAEGKRQWYVTQAQALRSYPGIRKDYERLIFGLALAELYAAVVPQDLVQPETYDLLEKSLGAIEMHPKPAVALVWSQVMLLQSEGFLPDFNSCVVTGETLIGPLVFISPNAGGPVSELQAQRHSDRYKVRIEILWGLSKIADLAEPPANLKFAEETLLALRPIWESVAEMALTANDAVMQEIRAKLNEKA